MVSGTYRETFVCQVWCIFIETSRGKADTQTNSVENPNHTTAVEVGSNKSADVTQETARHSM